MRTTCKGCRTAIPPSKGGPQRLWCSERCRKNQYDEVCSRCGGRTDGTNPGRKVTTMCQNCVREDNHETSAAWLAAELRHWNELYGRPPSAFHWSIGSIEWQRQAYAEGRQTGRTADATLAELKQRHRMDGPWPSLNAVQAIFGTWNAAIEAAGFEPIDPGSGRRRVPA